MCTRPFWVYPPAVLLLLGWAAPQAPVGVAVGLYALGLAAWTLLEWWLHRLMHVPARWERFRRFQEQAHLRHHREPDNLPGSIICLSGSIPLAFLLFGICLAAMRAVVPAVLLFAGLTSGYILYEFIHLATHARWRIPGLAQLQRYHALHHSRQWNRTFGVTCPLWDYVFGTAPR